MPTECFHLGIRSLDTIFKQKKIGKFLEPMGLNQNRLARYFKMSPQFWLGLRMDYELDMAEDMLEGRLEKEVTPMSAIG